MGKTKLSDKELKDLFQEGRFIVRALYADPWVKGKAKSDQVEDEIKYLHVKKHHEGEHANVERHGQRGRSATLLVPEVEMTLFNKVGFLYDADKSTVKAYMFKDSQTVSQALYNDFHNVTIDKKKFEPILSRNDFMLKYKAYREKAYTSPYNEVLANFFPESLIGIVGRDDSLDTKRKLLHLKAILGKNRQNMPMVLMDKGQVLTWTPDLNEVANIINHHKANILKYVENHPEEAPSQLLQQFAEDLGYKIDSIDFYQPLSAKNLALNNPFEFKAKEVIDYISKITDLPKGGLLSYGIEGRLLEVVNQRLVNDGKEKIQDLKASTLEEPDIDHLISKLDREMAVKNATHHLMEQGEIKGMVANITSNMIKIRSGETIDPKNQAKIDMKSSKIAEFFHKVASFLKNEGINEKIENFKSYKNRLDNKKTPPEASYSKSTTPK